MDDSDSVCRPNIAFAGLTAAGKTTHARRLAAELGYEYVSATRVVLGLLGIEADSEGVWFERFDEIRSGRAGDAADIELDRRLEAMAAQRQGTVFDTWALAWLSPSPMVRVWIESDLPSRARKCLVSQRRTRLPLTACRDLAAAKDGDTRAGFLRRHQFDLFTDRTRYDVIVCNTHLIPEATAECAQRGIETFAPVLLCAIRALLEHEPLEKLQSVAAEHPAEILRLRPWMNTPAPARPLPGRPTGPAGVQSNRGGAAHDRAGRRRARHLGMESSDPDRYRSLGLRPVEETPPPCRRRLRCPHPGTTRRLARTGRGPTGHRQQPVGTGPLTAPHLSSTDPG